MDVKNYQSDPCGKLNRIRYELHDNNVKVVKLLINNINIKFYKDTMSYDASLLSAALLNNDTIKTCYYPSKGNLGPMLDFYKK